MNTPHPYDSMCVCLSCVRRRHPEARESLRAGQADARKVGRFAFRLVPVTRNDGRELQLSRSGAVYEEKDGTLRRVGTAHTERGRIAVHEHGTTRGKAARKRFKRARHQAREALRRAIAAQQAKKAEAQV